MVTSLFPYHYGSKISDEMQQNDASRARRDAFGLSVFLLVTHLSQSFFPLVRRHLVALPLFAAGH
jgi:hypothetical protein